MKPAWKFSGVQPCSSLAIWRRAVRAVIPKGMPVKGSKFFCDFPCSKYTLQEKVLPPLSFSHRLKFTGNDKITKEYCIDTFSFVYAVENFTLLGRAPVRASTAIDDRFSPEISSSSSSNWRKPPACGRTRMSSFRGDSPSLDLRISSAAKSLTRPSKSSRFPSWSRAALSSPALAKEPRYLQHQMRIDYFFWSF